MVRCNFGAVTIASAGYDAQYEILEVEFVYGGQIWQYTGVPEDIWYRFKRETVPEHFFHSYIKGCYDEKQITSDFF